jgi:hypothetical protein
MQSLRSRRFLFSLLILVPVLVGADAALKHSPSIGVQPDESILIPTGQALTPAGHHIEVNDCSLGIVLSPNGALLAVVTGSNFAPRALHIIDVASKTLKQTISIGDSFVEVDFSPSGDTLYVGGRRNNDVKIFESAPDGQFVAAGSVSIPDSAPSGLKVNGDGSRLYMALNTKHSSRPTREAGRFLRPPIVTRLKSLVAMVCRHLERNRGAFRNLHLGGVS